MFLEIWIQVKQPVEHVLVSRRFSTDDDLKHMTEEWNCQNFPIL